RRDQGQGRRVHEGADDDQARRAYLLHPRAARDLDRAFGARPEIRMSTTAASASLGHAAWHEAADSHPEIAADRPHHGAADAIWFGDDSLVRDVDPLAIQPDTIMSGRGFPIDIADRGAIGVRAARAFAASQAVEPSLQFRVGLGVMSVEIAGMPKMGDQG